LSAFAQHAGERGAGELAALIGLKMYGGPGFASTGRFEDRPPP
jgi:hypothetical protein